MTNQIIISKLQQMPLSIQQEALHYIEFLLAKHGINQKPHKKRKAGTMKNLVSYIAADFDAPLDDFKEYM